MTRTACPTCKVIDLNEYRRKRAAARRREMMYYWLAIVPQRLSLGTLLLYGLLRLLLARDIPFAYYAGPLSMLWPVAFIFLVISYVSDLFLWEE